MPLAKRTPAKKELDATAEALKLMADLVFKPLAGNSMQSRHGRFSTAKIAEGFIKPSKTLSSFERIEIYNRQYWYRVLDCIWEDFPGVLAILGKDKFVELSEAYLVAFPSNSFALQDLGENLPAFMKDNPQFSVPYSRMAYETALVEWADIKAHTARTYSPPLPEDGPKIQSGLLQLKLQPHLSLFSLHYAIDDFLVDHKKDLPLHLVSNAVTEKKHSASKRTTPNAERIYLMVHRIGSDVYFTRATHSDYLTLLPLIDGATLEDACAYAYSRLKGCERQALADNLNHSFSEWTRKKLLYCPQV
jgi:Putative DNA-binding domain